MNQSIEFVLFYDGHCPICRKEIAWLQWKNRQGKLGFQDINAETFQAEHYGKTHAELMAEIHGQYSDGRLVKGVEVFYAAYQAVGLGWLMAPTRWPLFKPLFVFLYGWFARHRLALGRLLGGPVCTEQTCRIDGNPK